MKVGYWLVKTEIGQTIPCERFDVALISKAAAGKDHLIYNLQTMEDPILIAEYDVELAQGSRWSYLQRTLEWPILYEQEKIKILNALGNTIADIQHIGSTSVPGIAAKPVIDILLGIEYVPPQSAQISALETIGYLYYGELGIPGRHYFRRGMPRSHQIHLVKLDSKFWETHILFRDFLRAHPDAAQQYEALKRELAVKFRDDRERYTDSKAPLIQQMLVQARTWRGACSRLNLPRKVLE